MRALPCVAAGAAFGLRWRCAERSRGGRLTRPGLRLPKNRAYDAGAVIRHWAAFLFASVGGFALPACLYDADDRCGPNQVVISHDRCACIAGLVEGPGGCVPCGAHEEERSGTCVCEDGFTRADPGATCEPAPSGLGDACDEDAPCAPGEYPECHVTEGTAGYCTSVGCKSSSDCAADYTCEDSETEPYCRRPPEGYGDSCESDVDCAGGEATFCQPNEKICLVPCEVGASNSCSSDEVCCDFSLFGAGIFCTPRDRCLTGSAMQ